MMKRMNGWERICPTSGGRASGCCPRVDGGENILVGECYE